MISAKMFKIDKEDLIHKVFSIDLSIKHPGAEYHFTSDYAISSEFIIEFKTDELEKVMKLIKAKSTIV